MLEFLALAQECAPTVAPQTMAAVVSVESSYNPYAIGVVGGRLARQPTNSEEAVATAQQLASDGWNFSLGVAQVNRYNLPKYKVNYEEAFDPCTNLRIGSKILEDCYMRATKQTAGQQAALQAAFSCYYSGNFTRGFKPDEIGKPSYVEKVIASAGVVPAAKAGQAIPVVPSIKTMASGVKPKFDKAASPALPVSLKAQTTTQTAPAALPSDNAPVLLRAAITEGTTRLQPLAIDSSNGHVESVTIETPTEQGEKSSSAIVF